MDINFYSNVILFRSNANLPVFTKKIGQFLNFIIQGTKAKFERKSGHFVNFYNIKKLRNNA